MLRGSREAGTRARYRAEECTSRIDPLREQTHTMQAIWKRVWISRTTGRGEPQVAGAQQPTTHQDMFVRPLLRSRFEANIVLQHDRVDPTEFRFFKDELESSRV